MLKPWIHGLIRRQWGRLLPVTGGIAIAVALAAALGTFLAASQSTMTDRALASTAVDWQVQVAPGANGADVRRQVQATPGVTAALPVSFAQVSGFASTVAGSTQTTAEGVVLGLPPGYAAQFPGQIRYLSGAHDGVLLAQQTASNLHAAPGDVVSVLRPGHRPVELRVAGVIDLPQANSLFQRVGAPVQSQPSAPPDNVVLLPQQQFTQVSAGTTVSTQLHVARSSPRAHSPAAAYIEVLAAAHNLEARLAGAGIVGDNSAAALDAARGDAAYATMLFLFLGLPGSVLALLLTAALIAAGNQRRRSQQSLLKLRGLQNRQILGLAAVEAGVVGVVGGLLGLALGGISGRLAFGAESLRAAPLATWFWFGATFVLGLLFSLALIVIPAAVDLRRFTVTSSSLAPVRARSSLWLRTGIDFILLAASLVVFGLSSQNGYTLVIAPEGVPQISVSYWAFFGPVLFWLSTALLLWRFGNLVLRHGRRLLSLVTRPLAGRLSETAAAMLSRQHLLTRATVLVALAMSFAGSTAVFNATYQQQAEADAQLTNGADVTVTPGGGTPMRPARAAHLATVPGVRDVEPILHRYAYIGADLQDLFGVNPSTITRVTSLHDAYFAGGTAKQLMTRLSAQPDAILVSDETVKDFQLSPGDLIKLRLSGSQGNSQTVTFHYAGVVKEFPTAPKDSFFVANASYLAAQSGSDAAGAFLVDTGGRNQTEVAARLRADLGSTATVSTILQSRMLVGSSLTSVDLTGLTRLELGFGIVLAVGAGGLVVAAGVAERRRTLAVLTVLGARRRQLRGLVWAEAAVVASAGIVGGSLITWGLSVMLVKVLTGVFDPPPDAVAVPVVYVLLTVGATLGALALTGLLADRTANGRPAVEHLRDD